MNITAVAPTTNLPVLESITTSLASTSASDATVAQSYSKPAHPPLLS
tara:strand:+ start:2290 stop:2430 length:141 start_codon:yes stop_codon:yes gene_type:complete